MDYRVSPDLKQNAWLVGCDVWRRRGDRNFANRRRRTVNEWATEARRLPAGSSPVAQTAVIPYDHALMPHLIEPGNAVDDPTCRKVVLMFGIREGKTMGLCCNTIGRTVMDDAGNIYSVHPTDDDAVSWSDGELEPMIDTCLSDYFVEKKSRDAGRTQGFKKYRGGWIRIVSANSLTKFRGKSVKVLLLHEVDALNPEAIIKGFGRTTGYSNAIIILECTPTKSPVIDEHGEKQYRSQIQKHYEEGTQEKWFCRCRECEDWHIVNIGQFRHPSGEPALTQYYCPFCDTPHNAEQYRQMCADGRYFPTAGLSETDQLAIADNYREAKPADLTNRSFWRPGFCSLLPHHSAYRSKLHQIVVEHESAKKDRRALEVWTNEVAAEVWDDSEESETPPECKTLWQRREDYATAERVSLPLDCLVLVASVDVQGNRLEVEWKAWGRGERSWGIEVKTLFGDPRKQEVWDALNHELQRTFPRADKTELSLSLCFVDGSGFGAEMVYEYLRRLSRVTVPGVSGKIRACSGKGEHGHPVVDFAYRTVAKNLKGYHVGTWEAKDLIYLRLKLADAESEGFMHYSKRYDEGFFQQLTAERVTICQKLVKGRWTEVRAYENKQGARNEGLDLAVYNLAAFRKLRIWDFGPIESALEESRPDIEKPKPDIVPAPIRRHSNFATAGTRWR